MSRCAFVWADTGGNCRRYPFRGETLCVMHRRVEKVPTLPGWRHRIIAEMAELSVWWDGPGSEGRQA